MKSEDKKPDYRKIYSIVKKMYEDSEYFSCGHLDETYFTLRVFETAKDIIRECGKSCDAQCVLVASLLHDIGKVKLDTSKLFKKGSHMKWNGDHFEEWNRHPELGVGIARDILESLDHSDEFISRVCELVKNHDLRDGKNDGKSIELQILQDADLLADYGITGFIKPLLYGGVNHKSIINSIEYLKNKGNRIEHEDKLNLPISRKIAKEKLRFQKELIEEISLEILSDDL